LQEIREKESSQDPAESLRLLKERSAPSLVEQVEELVRAKLSKGKS
jgi:hypothetical protein